PPSVGRRRRGMSDPVQDGGGREAGAPPPAGPARWREVFRGALGRLTLGLFLLEVVGAVEILVVTTVMPRVVRDLGGLRLYGLAGALVFPGLASVAGADDAAVPVTSIRWPVQTALGSAALLGGLSDFGPWTGALVAAGLLLAVPGIRHLVRDAAAGSQVGLGWALAAGFLLGFTFFATDGFVPLLLTRVRHLTVAHASVVITLATLGWSAGSWWQSRVATSISAGRLVGASTVAVILGTLGVAAGAYD